MPSHERPRPSRSGNRLLDFLPEADLARLLDRAERVTVPIKETLAESGGSSRYAHFPVTAVLSAIIPLQDGSATEAATIGNEGMAGTELLTDGPTSVYRLIGQVEGESLRVPAAHFRALVAESRPLAELMRRYLLTLTQQSGQNAACNLRHDVEERMCRWLLMTHDRCGRDEFFLTQEFLSIMLGVRRQSVSLVAATLQNAGLITYARGNLTVVNRPGLESASCECYGAIQEAYRLVMGARGR